MPTAIKHSATVSLIVVRSGEQCVVLSLRGTIAMQLA